MPRWVEVSLQTDGEAAEAIAQELSEYCHQGLAIEQADIEEGYWDDGDVPPATRVIVRGYFHDDENAQATRESIERVLGYLNMMYPMPQPVFSMVDDADWAEAWKAHYHPVRLGRHILVRPRWIEVLPNSDDIVITLDPGMAFGTGTHPTTQLCLEALEDLVQPGLDVLDLGCGSGILAIGAALLGARRILAVDIDPTAVEITAENARENGVDQYIVAQQGSLETVLTSSRRFDLVVVNILAKVIIPMCQQGLGQVVRPGAMAVFSGLIDTQTEEVETALLATGLQPLKRRQIGDWMLIEAMRPHP